jgi:hypothetical protein
VQFAEQRTRIARINTGYDLPDDSCPGVSFTRWSWNLVDENHPDIAVELNNRHAF